MAWSLGYERGDGRARASGHFALLLVAGETVERQLGGGTRPAEQKALRVRAAGGVHEEKLIARFNALRHGADTKAGAKTRHRRNDRRTIRIPGELVHERAIDLDLVERNMRR